MPHVVLFVNIFFMFEYKFMYVFLLVFICFYVWLVLAYMLLLVIIGFYWFFLFSMMLNCCVFFLFIFIFFIFWYFFFYFGFCPILKQYWNVVKSHYFFYFFYFILFYFLLFFIFFYLFLFFLNPKLKKNWAAFPLAPPGIWCGFVGNVPGKNHKAKAHVAQSVLSCSFLWPKKTGLAPCRQIINPPGLCFFHLFSFILSIQVPY